MLTDLAALTPPLLVAVAFLIAAWAFVRHEMQRGKNAAEQERAEDSARDSPRSPDANESGGPSARRSFRENTPEGDADGDH
jgi:flagellar biosynthesis/type III secretory pathway M-ring protein FliF/YscJ